jgi:ADP-heptose:LPS heptosyltransferase
LKILFFCGVPAWHQHLAACTFELLKQGSADFNFDWVVPDNVDKSCFQDLLPPALKYPSKKGRKTSFSPHFQFVKMIKKNKYDLSIHLKTSNGHALCVLLGRVPRRIGVFTKTKKAIHCFSAIKTPDKDHSYITVLCQLLKDLIPDFTTREDIVYPIRTADQRWLEEYLVRNRLAAKSFFLVDPGPTYLSNETLSPRMLAETLILVKLSWHLIPVFVRTPENENETTLRDTIDMLGENPDYVVFEFGSIFQMLSIIQNASFFLGKEGVVCDLCKIAGLPVTESDLKTLSLEKLERHTPCG